MYIIQNMKDIEKRIIPELEKGSCVPSIIQLARKLKEPSSTLHFNLRKLEKEGKIKQVGKTGKYTHYTL